MNIFEFAKDLNVRLNDVEKSYDDIKAIDIKVLKKYWIDEKLIKQEIIFKLPQQHSYKDLVKMIDVIDKEILITILDYNNKTHYNFDIKGNIWLKNGDWFSIEEDYEFEYMFLSYYHIPIISDELLNGTTCTFGETSIRYIEGEDDE